jgi:GTP-binding protein Era
MIAVVGRANVGKSTLVNALVEEKISIVSPVAQTTRNRIRGIWTDARGQLIFLDTPGIHKASHDLGRLMNRMARNAAEGADIILLALDATALPRIEDEGWMRKLGSSDIPLILALNKIDAITPKSDQRKVHQALWDRIMRKTTKPAPAQWIELSAKTGVGLDPLRNLLLELAPEGPLLFPEEMLSDFPRKLMIADIVREKLFKVLNAELPYAVAVRIASINEEGDRWSVQGDILVDKPSQKGIVIGTKGRLLKLVILESERELSESYERKVSLRLWVRVHKNWAKDTAMLRQLGYTL